MRKACPNTLIHPGWMHFPNSMWFFSHDQNETNASSPNKQTPHYDRRGRCPSFSLIHSQSVGCEGCRYFEIKQHSSFTRFDLVAHKLGHEYLKIYHTLQKSYSGCRLGCPSWNCKNHRYKCECRTIFRLLYSGWSRDNSTVCVTEMIRQIRK